jgi:hypothetical protein
MWIKGNKINCNLIKKIDFILIKFNCGLCSGSNEIELYDFYLDFFKRRPDYIWETNIKCPNCDGANYHDLKIYTKGIDLIIDVENERLIPEYQTEINKETIHYSLVYPKDRRYLIEIPLEFDIIESIVGNNSYLNYSTAINEIQQLLKKNEINTESTLLKFMYSSIISIFETYLFDLFINIVNSNPSILRKVVEDYKIFDREKIEKSNVFKEYDEIKNAVIKELQKINYHNINVITPLFKKSLSIDFSNQINGLSKMIEIRHDIVHRNGEDFNGNKHNIKLQQIDLLIKKVNEIVNYINKEYEIKNIQILPKDKE